MAIVTRLWRKQKRKKKEKTDTNSYLNAHEIEEECNDVRHAARFVMRCDYCNPFKQCSGQLSFIVTVLLKVALAYSIFLKLSFALDKWEETEAMGEEKDEEEEEKEAGEEECFGKWDDCESFGTTGVIPFLTSSTTRLTISSV